MKRLIKNKYIRASFLCVIIYTLYLKMMEIYPFGEYSILKSDMYQQYINFFCYLREVILHGKSIAISWNLGLANNFYTTFAKSICQKLSNNKKIKKLLTKLKYINIMLISNK